MVAYVASSTIVANGDGGVTVNYPAGVAVGHICVFVGGDADNESFSAGLPNGWFNIHSDSASTNLGYTVAWHRYDGTEGASETFDTASSAGQLIMGVMHAYSGCIKIGVPFIGAIESVVANQTTHAITITGGTGLFKVAFHIIEDNVAVTDNGGADWTTDDNQSTTQGSDGRLIAESSTNTGSTTSSFTTGTSEYSGSVALNLIPETHRSTIALDTANGHNFGVDDTPSLEFTGSDTNGDDLEYEIQIGDDSAIGILDDNYPFSNHSAYTNLAISNLEEISQSFTGDGNYITRIKIATLLGADCPGNITAKIYAHSGTFGTSSVPTGSSLADSTPIYSGDLSSTKTEITFDFPNPYKTTNTTKYCLVIHFDGGTTGKFIQVSTDTSSPSHGGNFATRNPPSAWVAQSGTDMCFEIYTSISTVFKESVTPDATFTNTVSGGDTHPFNEGEKIDYTVQAGDALADDTWYWRARCKDPTGEDVWSDWSSIRNFIIGEVERRIFFISS